MQTNSALLTDLGNRASQYLGQLLQNPRANARLSLGATLVLLIMVSYSAASMTWMFFDSTTDAPVILASSPHSQAKPEAGASLASVSNLHLFGKADKSKPVSNAPIIAPETRLQLILRGVFASDDQGQAMAIIAEKGSKDKTYVKNDVLPGNASLHEIYADRVILSRNGKLETLRLLTKEADIKGVSRKGRKPRARPAPVPKRSNRNPGSRLSKMRDQLRTNRQHLLRNIRITPVKKGDSIQGYNFSHRDPALMRELGLQPQDVITSINGTPVSNMGSMMEILRTMDSLQELNLSILRRGTPQSLTVQLN